MKRSIKFVDHSVVSCLNDEYINEKSLLRQIADCEENLDKIWTIHRRRAFILNSEPDPKMKILRVFIRHTYTPSTSAGERPYFTLTIEGHILDPKYRLETRFCQFFERVRVRVLPSDICYEWNTTSFPDGALGDCLQFKIHTDSSISVPIPIQITFSRSTDVLTRYELSPPLRSILPHMPSYATEGEVMTAMVNYVRANNLLDARDKRLIRCSPELKTALGCEALMLHNLRSRLLSPVVRERETNTKEPPPLQPSPALEVDYNLLPASCSLPDTERRFSPPVFARSGGRSFDMVVDVLDGFAVEQIASIHEACSVASDLHSGPLSQLGRKAEYTARLAARTARTALRASRDRPHRLASRLLAIPPERSGELARLAAKTILEGFRLADVDEAETTEGSSVSVAEIQQRLMDTHTALRFRPAGDYLGVTLAQHPAHRSVPSDREATIGVGAPMASSIHGARGFVDVGEDPIFGWGRDWVRGAAGMDIGKAMKDGGMAEAKEGTQKMP